MSLAKTIRAHLLFHEPTYLMLRLGLILFGGFGLLLWGSNRHSANSLKKIRAWPRVEATILDSRIVISDASTETSVRMRTTISGQLRYPHPQAERTLPFHLDSGTIQPRDWETCFKPGSHVLIRYNPENPDDLSFLDFAAVP